MPGTDGHAALQTAEAWVEAANVQDRERLLRLSHPDIEIVGPRGTAQGHEVLLAWLARAGLTLATKRTFAGGEGAVLAQHGVWRSSEGEPQGEAEVASSFLVKDGQIVELARHDTLAEALAQVGLSEADEVLD